MGVGDANGWPHPLPDTDIAAWEDNSSGQEDFAAADLQDGACVARRLHPLRRGSNP